MRPAEQTLPGAGQACKPVRKVASASHRVKCELRSEAWRIANSQRRSVSRPANRSPHKSELEKTLFIEQGAARLEIRCTPDCQLHTHFLLSRSSRSGDEFVVIRIGPDHLPPLSFAVLRFAFAVVPAVFFLKRPPVSWRNLALYGVLIGPGQFGLLFVALNGLISPGLASLVVQAQVFFTIGLARLIADERVRPIQLAALALATAGIAVIMANVDAATTPLGLFLSPARRKLGRRQHGCEGEWTREHGRLCRLVKPVCSSPSLRHVGLHRRMAAGCERHQNSRSANMGSGALAVLWQQPLWLCRLGLASRTPPSGNDHANGAADPGFWSGSFCVASRRTIAGLEARGHSSRSDWSGSRRSLAADAADHTSWLSAVTTALWAI